MVRLFPCAVASVVFLSILSATLSEKVKFADLEARRLLVTPNKDGKLSVIGYALPPSANDLQAPLPDVGAVLHTADDVPVSLQDVNSAMEAVGRGDLDAVLLPVMYDVDGVQSGKQLAGFIRLEFITPDSVEFKEEGGDKPAKKSRAAQFDPSKSHVS